MSHAFELPTATELPTRQADGDPFLELTGAESAQLKDMAEEILEFAPDTPLEQQLERLSLLAHKIPLSYGPRLNTFRLTGRPYEGH
ncbi:hypothetical protein [Streptomyces sp. NPDC003032]